MDGANVGLIGGMIGSALGLFGGVVGTWFSIRNTNGPRERAFMVRFSITTWIAVLLFLVAMIALPSPYRFLAWIPYGVALPLGIRYCNRRQAQIRAEEHRPGDATANE